MKFCPLAYNNVEIDSAGYYKPCCISSKRFLINDECANAIDYNLPDIMKKSDRNEWIENFDAHYESDCEQCHALESAGGESKRTREIREWNSWLKFTKGELQSLDLKMGNTCNLMCAICAPNASSKWASFYRSIDVDPIFGYQRWPDRDDFWNGLNEYAYTIQKIELAGGEPFMIKKQEILIKYLIERDLAKNIDITWFTNCTIWPENLVQYFKHFRYVRINLSLDNTHKQFEYIRYPAKWDETYRVFTKFKELQDAGEINLGISHSIGMLNAYWLPEFHAWAREQQVKVFNNIVMEPLGAQDLPYEFKLQVKQKLEAQTDTSYQENPIVGENNWFVKYMMANSSNTPERWQSHLNKFVIPSRKELDIFDAFPELKEHINV